MARARQRGPRGEGYCTFDERRNRWRVTVPTAGGRSLTRYFTEESSAHAWHEEQRKVIRAGRDPVRPPVLSKALADYIAVHVPGTSPGTKRQYEYRSAKLLSILGDPIVTAIGPARIASLDQELRATLADGTVQGLLNLLQSLYDRLIALDIGVAKNPVSAYRAVTPRRARLGRAAREPVVLDPAHCRLLLEALEDEPLRPFLIWLICLPFRVSELRGLRWANVQSGVIAIEEQRTHADPHTPQPPKSKSGRRQLPLARRLLLLAGPRGGGLVFTNAVGGPVYDATIRKTLTRARKRLKLRGVVLPDFRVHDLRHTAASNILRLGCPIDYERALLGHAPRDITEHYARPDVEVLRSWSEQWAAVILDPRAAAQRSA